MSVNPFFVASRLPYGLPPFAEIRLEHFEPAFEEGMRQQRAEVEAIASDPLAPTFENTLIALERSGEVLDRVAAVFFSLSSSDSSDELSAIEERIAPRLAAHQDAIRLDPRLAARVHAVGTGHERLDDVDRYLVARWETAFRLAGASLDDRAKAALREINERLSVLTTRFEKQLLADTNDLAVVIDDEAELGGLDAGERSAALRAGDARGLPGSAVIDLVLPTGHPSLAALTDPAVRERVMTASRARGGRDGANDNRPVLLEIVRLRARRAALLGFDSHAAAVVADQTAGTPEAVAEMLGRLAPAAARKAAEEAALLREALEEIAPGAALRASDGPFLAERVRAERFDVDRGRMRPYFEAERVLRDGVFHAATRLYGITFEERPDLIASSAEARVFEVRDEDGTGVGLYLLDLYTRDAKRGGAWMNSLAVQSNLRSPGRVVTNTLNVAKPADGEPTLLTVDEVTTLFHEFGHALHGLFATVRYPTFGGTSVHRDVVEFPSQVNEMWMFDPEILAHYAKHVDTGEPMPQEMVDRLLASREWGEGFATSEYLAAAILDQAWHGLSPEEADAVEDVAAFEAQALADAGLDDPVVPPRYSSTYFAHTFSGGYDAGYYSYIWSEVLDADTVEWFGEHGGLRRENGDRFRELVLGIGGSRDPLAAYREFRGRDARIEPLLVRRGLTGAAERPAG